MRQVFLLQLFANSQVQQKFRPSSVAESWDKVGMEDLASLLDTARSLEEAGKHAAALDAYQAAFDRSGQDPAIAADLGRLAVRLGQHAIGEHLLLIALQADSAALDSRLHLAHALREQHRYDEALRVLTRAAHEHPAAAALWSAIGTVRMLQGAPEEALAFLDQAVRLDPAAGAVRYARANALADLGEHARALDDYAAALERLPEADRDRVRVPMALSRLALGDLGGGWDDYRSRLSPHRPKSVRFEVEAPLFAFDPAEPLEGRALLLMAEQGLGDEVLFANAAPDVLEAIGARGRLILAVEPRLVALFARSFPQAEVIAYGARMEEGVVVRTAEASAEAWAPLAAPLRRFRRRESEFPDTAYLKPDPARVDHWRRWLAGAPGPKVGLLWKSLKLDGERLHKFAAFDAWAPVLRTPGVCFVNMQYGDCAAELAHARHALGVDILQPPGIDLKQDLDDVAALACALDLTIGFANATVNLAGACGAPLWLVAGQGAWTLLGTGRYPWYPQARVFLAGLGGWPEALRDAASALAGRWPA